MRKHLSSPWFLLVKHGIKTVEGRIDKGEFHKGEKIVFWNGNEVTERLISDVIKYKSFREMIEAEGLHRVLPGILTIEEGVKIYRKYYSEDDEKMGVIAIRLS